MTETTIIVGILSGAVLGALMDWLIQTRLPSKPTRASTIVIVVTSAILVLLLTFITLQERGGSSLNPLPVMERTNGLVLCTLVLSGVVVMLIGIRAIKSISIHIRSELLGARTDIFVDRRDEKLIPSARLINTQEDKEGIKSIPLVSRYRLRIGRDSTFSEIVIDDPSVSKLHCSIHYSTGRFWLMDEGSLNGTYVNGEIVETSERRELQPGDRISIGLCEFLFAPD